KHAGKIVVATTTDLPDERIVRLCERKNIECFRGHPTDLLDRHYEAAVAFGADAVAKIPSDCPLVDPEVIDQVLEAFLSNRGLVDYVSNLHPMSYPDGNDVEVVPFQVLEEVWKEAKRPFEREHTTPFIWDRPERYRLMNVKIPYDLSSSYRW